MKASEVLLRAAAIIEPEGRWTQRAAARKAYGGEANPFDPKACKFCALGALQLATYDRLSGKMDSLLYNIAANALEADIISSMDIADYDPCISAVIKWNDAYSRKQKEVVDQLRSTARRLQEEECLK